MAKGIGSDIETLVLVGGLALGGYLLVKHFMPNAISNLLNSDMGGTDFGVDNSPGGGSSWGADSTQSGASDVTVSFPGG